MSRFPWLPAAATRRLLALHLQRLRDFFGHLARGLRDRLASAAGEAIAAVVRTLLEGSEMPYRPTSYAAREIPSWREEVEESWQEDWPETYPSESAETPAQPASRWRPTLAAALQAVAWWLRQPVAGLPATLAMATSIAASVAAAAGMPVAAGLALAGTVPGLIALADAAREGVETLAQQALP